jgi:hypothetical protein
MILDKEVEVKMNAKHISGYKLKGYVCKVGEIIKVKIEDLPSNSKCFVNVKCDVCFLIKKCIYINYTKLINRYNIYRCSDCGCDYRKLNCIDKYGVDNPTKLKSISDKISIAYHNKSDEQIMEINKKIKNTMFLNNGDWFVKSDSYKEKIKKTSLDKYGVDDYRSTTEFKNKVKNTLELKYGVSHPSHIPSKSVISWFGNKINGVHSDSNIRYQGTYELDFINKYYKDINISKIDPIKYDFNYKSHVYHPDFYISDFNLIVEIKSTYTYNYDLYKNLAKKESCENLGYNFIFIIDKNYQKFEELLNG